MIERIEHALGTAGRQRVVQGRREVQQDRRHRERAGANHCRATARGGGSEKDRQRRDGQQQAEAMAQAVGHFLANGLRAFNEAMGHG